VQDFPSPRIFKRFNMSEQFHQYYFPCVECIVRAACKDKENMMEQIKVRGDVPSLGVPIWDYAEKSYHKGLLECTVNILKNITDKINKSEPENTPAGLMDNIPMQYVHLFISMADIMCHIINSTSWREGELQEFDRFEIERRLKMLPGWVREGASRVN